jgi:hypothetical protein
VWEIVPQVDQRGDQPVDEHQLMPGTCPCPTFPGPATCFVTAPLDNSLLRIGQFLDQTAQMLPGDTDEQLMRENLPVDHDHHGPDHPTPRDHPLNRNHAPARKCSVVGVVVCLPVPLSAPDGAGVRDRG